MRHGEKLGGPDRVSSDSDALAQAIRRLDRRQDLAAEETEAAFTVVMQGHASEAQMSALLMGLRAKGETPHEVAGGVRALRKAMVPVKVTDPDAVVDTCGTGGGAITTFNISTAAAFVLAGGGVPVAKHGNRSFNSRCGSADVLEALGIHLPLTPQRMEQVYQDVGLSFLFAPLLHPAMKHLAPVRKELGVPTIMNILGPLTNPARARRQVVGVSDVVRVENGTLEEYVFDPARELGWNSMNASELAGAEPEDNARVIEAVLKGEGSQAARAAVALNAAAGFFVAGSADSLKDGLGRAEAVLEEGKGLEALERVREATRSER
jgi:anthranilate phosphoribosyltransferase